MIWREVERGLADYLISIETTHFTNCSVDIDDLVFPIQKHKTLARCFYNPPEFHFPLPDFSFCTQPLKLSGGAGCKDFHNIQPARLLRHRTGIEHCQVPEDSIFCVQQGHSHVTDGIRFSKKEIAGV